MRNVLGAFLISLAAMAVAHGAMTVAAPEFDPVSALAALSLLGGGLAVLRGRRRKK